MAQSAIFVVATPYLSTLLQFPYSTFPLTPTTLLIVLIPDKIAVAVDAESDTCLSMLYVYNKKTLITRYEMMRSTLKFIGDINQVRINMVFVIQ